MTVLRVEGVSKSFAGLQALTDISFEVDTGIVGVIGPNGAGKTTLFNVIAGTYPPTSGRIVFQDREITGWAPHRVARGGLARTFQLMRPFPNLTLLENVTVAAFHRHPRRAAAEAAARALIERVGLAEWESTPAGQLSTAGRKRLELARALALRPSLLLLDEVLSGLVPSERAPLIELLKQLRDEGLVMLFVEHVMAAVMALSDHVLVLHHGEMLAAGDPHAVVKDPAVIEAYLGEEFLLAEA